MPASLSTPTTSSSTSAKPFDPREHLRVIDVVIPGGAWEKRAVVLVPDPPPQEELPVLVALHGMGETVDPVTGAHGWLEAYDLDTAIAKLRDPPLDEGAYRGLVSDEHLAEVNAGLQKQPYRGLVVVCPYLPREIGGDVSYDAYARYLSDELLPRVRAETPATSDVKATGIDGVSLGGYTSLELGLMRPDVFGAIGTLQAAVSLDQTDRVADEIAARLGGRPLRITTSEGDVYREALTALDEKLRARGVAHEFTIEAGPHDYIWNKGPGAVEMLMWNDRVLRR